MLHENGYVPLFPNRYELGGEPQLNHIKAIALNLEVPAIISS